MSNISIILRDARKDKGVSQQVLADAVGVSKETVYLWENGKRKMTLDNADRAFKALGVSVTIGAEEDT